MQQTNYNTQINREIQEIFESGAEKVALKDWIQIIEKAAEET